MKKIALLGCTGSIGRSAVKVLQKYRSEFSVELLANFSKTEEILCLKKQFPEAELYSYQTAEDKEFLYRPETYNKYDIVINGISGIAGLKPSVACLKAGKILATANKESLVCGGNYLKNIMNVSGGCIHPIDSEHSAVWQILDGRGTKDIKRIVLTASGGAFRDFTVDRLQTVRGRDALLHPNWVMGKKVTVDCATLVNKGMEIIEAKHLFGINNVTAVGHKESIVHALIEFMDNSFLAALSMPDMVLPIQYSLFYPEKRPSTIPVIDLESAFSLNFFPPDKKKFPCLELCAVAEKYGDIGGTILNAADEIAVELFLQDKCDFYDIANMIERAINRFAFIGNFSDIEEVFGMDRQVKEYILSEYGK